MLSEQQIKIFRDGGVAVLPTGSVYGLMAQAQNEQAVARVYKLKNRDPSKPSIILIADAEETLKYGVARTDFNKAKEYWPGMVSVIFKIPHSTPEYLHKGTNSLAFRVPLSKDLRGVLAKTGPLIAPSANPEGREPATTIAEAKSYFGDSVDFYIDGGVCDDKPSKLIKLNEAGVETLRE